MRPSRLRLAVYASIVVSLGLVGNVAAGLINVPERARPAVLIATGILAAVAVIIEVSSRDDAPRLGDITTIDVNDTLGRLADIVAADWRREEQYRRVHDPFPIPISWEQAAASLMDHWANIRKLPGGGHASPLNLAGSISDVISIYKSVPSGRLVVLGRPGAGKSILTIRFALGMIESRQPGDPVPVILPLSAWNPTLRSLSGWLSDQLQERYPILAAIDPLAGQAVGQTFVVTGAILPVLDGLDEMADALRTVAIREINASSLPLLLTSRLEEYEIAVESSDVITSAAVVQLSNLSVSIVRSYLPRTARPNDKPSGDTKWTPVLNVLETSDVIASVFQTPLMVSLGRVAYSDNPNADPGELLDGKRFGSKSALENHLFDSYVAEVYRSPDVNPPGAADAERWLISLARHLQRLGTLDFAWWELRNGLPRSLRLALFATLGALISGLVLYPIWLFGAGFGAGFTIIPALWNYGRQPIRSPLRFRGRGTRTALLLSSAALAGAAGGWIGARISKYTGALVLDPYVGSKAEIHLDSIWGLIGGLVAGLCVATAISFDLAGRTADPRPRGIGNAIIRAAALSVVGGVIGGIGLGSIGAFTIGMIAAPMAGLIGDFETTLDTSLAVTPALSLRVDRRNANVERLLLGSCFAISVFLAAAQRASVVLSLALAIGSAAVIAAGNGLLATASGQWLVTWLFLSVTGRMPFAPMSFLEDAHKRGVLRQSGMVFQFRHVRLQERLCSLDFAAELRDPRAFANPTTVTQLPTPDSETAASETATG